MISDQQFNKISNYVQENAREIDSALFDFHFSKGDPHHIVNALEPYQNPDGGFGNAIEPDFRLPQSTALATCVAFNFMDVATAPSNLRQRALGYLSNTYDHSRNGWKIVTPQVNDHPHAPWWGYESAINTFGWGNPGAELLGYLIKYNGDTNLISVLKEKALTRIQQVNPNSFHEVLNFKALFHMAGSALQRQLKDPLEQLIIAAIETNQDAWSSYVATPLKFIASPDDPFIHLFDQELITANLRFVLNELVDNSHWSPNWDWAGNHPEEWPRAKQEWAGHLTVKNMFTLKKFDMIAAIGA